MTRLLIRYLRPYLWLLVGVITLATQGLNLGIDFTGGTVWQVEAGKAEVTDVQRAMADLGYTDV